MTDLKNSTSVPWALSAVLVALLFQLSSAVLGASPARTLLAQSQTSEQSTVLVDGKTVFPSIVSSENRIFTFELAEGQCADLTLTWPKIDLNVVVFNPDRTRLFPPPILVRASGGFPISILAKQHGQYSVEIRTAEQTTATAQFELTLSNVRSASDSDKKRFRAQELLVAGNEQKSVDSYLASLKLWQEVGDELGQAYTLQQLARLYLSLKQVKEAEERYAELIAIRKRISDQRSLLYTLRDIGGDYRRFNSLEKASDYLKMALEIARSIKDRIAEASLFYSIGFVEASGGHTSAALEFFEQARKLHHDNGDRLNEARTLNAMGGAHNLLGDQATALSYYQQALPIFQELRDRSREATISNNLGVAYDDLGQWQEAKNYYSNARSVGESLLNNDLTSCKAGARQEILDICTSLADYIDNIGELHNTLGDPDKALEEFATTLPIRKAVNQPRWLSSTLSKMCYSYVLKGMPAKAIPLCEEAITLSEETKQWVIWASTQTILGMAYAAFGKTAEAFKRYDHAVQRHREINLLRGEGIALNQLGSLSAATGQHEQGLARFNEALKLWRGVKDEDGETITLFNIAKLERDRGNFSAAHEHVQKAISIVENRRATLNSQRLLASYFANKQDYYELAIDVQMNLAKTQKDDVFVAKALEANERARGRRLIDALAEARLVRSRESASMTPNNAALKAALDQQAALALKLTGKANARTVLLGRKHTKEEQVALNKEIEKLAAEIDAIEARIKGLNRAYATLVKPQPLNAKEIQKELDNDTTLVEYALGEKRSYAWVVNADSIKGVELPPRKEIEDAADRLTQILKAGENQTETRAQKELRHAKYVEASTSLSRKILKPISHLLTKKRLVIVADGVLQLVSFTALPNPGAGANGPSVASAHAIQVEPPAGRVLLEDHEIVYLPSASVLAVQRSMIKNRKPAPHAIAIFANPVFELNDERVSKAKKKNAAGGPLAAAPPPRVEPWKDGMRDLGIDKIYTLPFSGREANDIRRLVPEGEAYVATGFEANRAMAMSPKLARYRIIHFATHGFLNLEHPDLSGIVFSLVDEKGNPQDGFLYLHDIYNLNLPAELVVLSACQTGVGKQVKGEGLIALTRGFMYAGASRLVASLWKVNDAATAELMARFYKEMFNNGKRPAEALRDAQLDLSKEKRYSSPYYWAGFVLQGEWR